MDNYSNYNTYDSDENHGQYCENCHIATGDCECKDCDVCEEANDLIDIELKQKACSHIDTQTFMAKDGEESQRCPACGLWESGDTTL
jgi:hypothetical protein